MRNKEVFKKTQHMMIDDVNTKYDQKEPKKGESRRESFRVVVVCSEKRENAACLPAGKGIVHDKMLLHERNSPDGILYLCFLLCTLTHLTTKYYYLTG